MIQTERECGKSAESNSGVWFPPYSIDNDALAEYLRGNGVTTGTGKEPTAEGLTKVSGIERRYFLQPLGAESKDIAETVPEIAIHLAESAIAKKRWDPRSVEEIIFCSSHPFGEKGSQMVAEAIEANNCRTTDIYAACAGGPHGLIYAAENVGKGARVLLIAAEHYSARMGKDLNLTIFSDGGAVWPLVNGEDVQFMWWGHVYEPNPAIQLAIDTKKYPPGAKIIPVPISPDHFRMDGPTVLKWALEGTPFTLTQQAYSAIRNQSNNIHIIPHPGSGRLVQAFGQKLQKEGIQASVSAEMVRTHGNLASASTFVELHALLSKNRVKEGDVFIFAGFGAGFDTAVVSLQFLKHPNLQ